MNKKFRVGDEVRVTKTYDDGARKGMVGVVEGKSGGSYTVKFPKGFPGWGKGNRFWFLSGESLTINKKGSRMAKPKNIKFLLKYDLEEDPIEEFETMAQVEARIKELVDEEEDLKRESMVVYEVKSRKAVTVKTETKISYK